MMAVRAPRLRRRSLAGVVILLLLLPVQALAPAAAAGELTVAQAIARQDGSTATVRGYVVGQPTATNTVVTSGFPNDYALALADAPGETNTAAMVYVQIPTAFRSAWGLKSNPGSDGRPHRRDRRPGGVLLPPWAEERHGVRVRRHRRAVGGSPYDQTYYASAMGLSGAALKAELHDIIRVHSKLTYDQVWDALRDTDEDPANAGNVLLLYTGRSQSKTLNGGGVDDWNREHVWAKSHGDFGTATGPGTDVHHLRPTDVTVNGTRGNKDFDNGGAVVGEAPGNYTDADSFEPRDAVKGDVARMVLYMAVRYEGGDGWADLEPNDLVSNGSAPYHGRLSVLLAWNAQDPPSTFEMRRNDRIYDVWQGNRNPFIDHPEWADSIWN